MAVVDRRSFITSGLGALGVLNLSRGASGQAGDGVRAFTLVASETDIDIGRGQILRTWAYNSQVPGPVIRAVQGERIRVTLENRLTVPTTITGTACQCRTPWTVCLA